MKKYFPFFLALLLPTYCFAGTSLQDSKVLTESPQPALKVIAQLRAENLTSSDYQDTNSADEYVNSGAKVNFFSNATLNKKWFLEVNFRAEQVKQQSASIKDYGGEGAYLREARLGYNDRNIAIFAGKFRPFFGIAWRNGRNNWMNYTANNQEQFDYNNTRGVWTDYIANNYAQAEKLGIGSVIKSGNAKTIGKYELGLSFFTNDRKNFDNSAINNRVSATKQDALPGDTRSLKSYVASLDVSFDFAPDEKLFYRFAYIDLAVNSLASSVPSSKVADQKGFSAAINYQYPFSPDFSLNGLAEYVSMKNIGGNSDVNDDYFTSSLVGNIFQNWNVTTAYASRKNIYLGQNGFDQNMAEISAGYRFDKNTFFDSLLIQTAYRNLRTDYHSSLDTKNTIGVLVRYIKNF
jgi:hypothetical protein